jgi:SAM-dependent methyltransferase
MKNYSYPNSATERFDNANFHIKYCLSFVKNYINGNVLEVGAGCGSFTRNYISQYQKKITLTEVDKRNIFQLKKRFKKYNNIKIKKNSIDKINDKFNTILYFHVLEHIKNDMKEIQNAKKKLKKGGYLIFMVPAHQKIYSNLDKAVGHHRRYEKDFFKTKLLGLKRVKIVSVDIIGYYLYFLNKLFFKKETFPSDFKIFIWDKLFTPLTILVDKLTNYNFGKCIITIYKK